MCSLLSEVGRYTTNGPMSHRWGIATKPLEMNQCRNVCFIQTFPTNVSALHIIVYSKQSASWHGTAAVHSSISLWLSPYVFVCDQLKGGVASDPPTSVNSKLWMNISESWQVCLFYSNYSSSSSLHEAIVDMRHSENEGVKSHEIF